ncbi:hypothetical protein K502DRAFT_366390 [Neoconidiobolus thromboides FSU 785]|nr:hypothetical protein K502DRAFT_366390 [Neoconidiobolus thromboides FSU 785]
MKFLNIALFSAAALSVNTLSIRGLFSSIKREFNQGVVTNDGKATIYELCNYDKRFNSAATVKELTDLLHDCEYYYREVVKNKEGRDKELEAEIDGIEEEVFDRMVTFAGEGSEDEAGKTKVKGRSPLKRTILKVLKL